MGQGLLTARGSFTGEGVRLTDSGVLCSVSGTEGEGPTEWGLSPFVLHQCLNLTSFGEDALYPSFLGQSIGKLKASTGVCMPTLDLCLLLSQEVLCCTRRQQSCW